MWCGGIEKAGRGGGICKDFRSNATISATMMEACTDWLCTGCSLLIITLMLTNGIHSQ